MFRLPTEFALVVRRNSLYGDASARFLSENTFKRRQKKHANSAQEEALYSGISSYVISAPRRESRAYDNTTLSLNPIR